MSENPIDIIRKGNYSKVPFMIGYTDREMILYEIFAARENTCRYTEDFEKQIPYTLNLRYGTEKSKELAERIKKFYFKNEEPSIETLDYDYIVNKYLYNI